MFDCEFTVEEADSTVVASGAESVAEFSERVAWVDEGFSHFDVFADFGREDESVVGVVESFF